VVRPFCAILKNAGGTTLLRPITIYSLGCLYFSHSVAIPPKARPRLAWILGQQFQELPWAWRSYRQAEDKVDENMIKISSLKNSYK
jgi:hypothetical protein